MIGILSPWPPSVAHGSGTTVSQNRLVEALALAGVESEVLYTSCFATSVEELAERRHLNAQIEKGLEEYQAVFGIDGEGWLWAAMRRKRPFVAFCEAVLAEVVPFEEPRSASLLETQANWEAAAASSADAVVARSAFAAARAAEAYSIQRERITVVPIPFDLDAWRASLPRAEKEPLVLAVGHAYPRKNYRALLEAWPDVVAAHPAARLAIAGTGPELPLLERMATHLPSVSLLGHVSYAELLALHARAHVFCHASLQENFGIAVVEGLASGAAVVHHDQPALRENTAGLPGVLTVDGHDPTALSQGLIEALEGPSLWPDTRLAALREKLRPSRIGQQLAALVRSLEEERA